MKSIRKGLAEILTVLLVIGLLPVSPGRSVSFAGTKDNTASESNAFENSVTLGTGSDTLEDGMVANPDNGTSSDAVPDITIGTSSDAAFDRTVTVSGYTIRVTAEAGVFPEGSSLTATEITDSRKKETINEKVSEEAGKETAVLISFDIKVLDRSGNEAEPDLTKGKPVVTFGKVNAEKLTGQSDAKLEVYHLDDDLNSAEKLNVEEDKNAETVKTEAVHFSIYSFAYGAGTQTGTWNLEDYDRSTDSDAKVITLNMYTGSDTELYVPGTVTINTIKYQIALKEATSIWYGNNITGLSFGSGVILPIDCSYMFYNCSNLSSLDLSSFNTSSVQNMASMFDSCSGLMSLDLSSFNTSSVQDMNHMFASCSGLTGLNLDSFNTSSVQNMASMFDSCAGLMSLDLSSFNTSSVQNMLSMFYGCIGLTSLDLSSFDTSHVQIMENMFYSCIGLMSLDLSSFDTSSVQYMSHMFINCSKLQSLDLSNFDMSNTKFAKNMFYYTGLESLWIPIKYGGSNPVTLPGTFNKVGLSGNVDTTPITSLPTNETESYQIVKQGTTVQTSITVTFDSKGGNPLPQPQSLNYGGTVTKPDDPAKNGYTFGGWYRNKALTTAWDFANNKVGYSITLYAKWNVTITYKSADPAMGTVSTPSESIPPATGTAKGSTATAYAGYHFVGWKDASGSEVSTDSTFVPAKVNGLNVMSTYTANFAPDTYTVSFNANGHGTAPADEVGTYGYTVTEPAAPSESGYTFGGWYKEAACTNAWNFASDLVGGDMTLYAKWTKNSGTGTSVSGSDSGSSTTKGSWSRDTKGWRYSYPGGGYASNAWVKVNGKWYHFNSNGYMQTGWILDNGRWYYLDSTHGDMKTGYMQAPDGFFYYFWPDGSMAVGDVVIDGVTHHFNDQKPDAPTYTQDPVTGEWKPNGSNAIPYGAEMK